MFIDPHFPCLTYSPSFGLGLGKGFVSARCNICISRLCYDVSVRLSVTFVHCGHKVQWIPDTFACLDRWMSLLLTDNALPGSSDGMMPGFLVEEGRGHLVLC